MARPTSLVPYNGEIRTLPSRCLPVHGESFNSYMERLAWLNDVPLAVMISATGLVTRVADPIVAAWGAKMTEAHLSDFSFATRLRPDAVEKLLLNVWSGSFLQLSDVDPRSSKSVQAASLREWVLFNGSRFCPECLAENPKAWLLKWKLPWVFACTKHSTLLLDHCADCRRPSGAGRGDARAMPGYLGQMLEPGRCRNIRAVGLGGRGVSSPPCRGALWEQTAPKLLVGGRALRAQAIIDHHLEMAYSGNEQTACLNFAQETRSLVALGLLASSTSILHVDEPCVEAAAEAHIEQQRLSALDRKSRGRNGARIKVHNWSRVPPALMCAAMTPAVEIALLETADEMVSALLPYVTAYRQTRGSVPRDIPSAFRFSPRLKGALEEAITATGSFGQSSTHRPNVTVNSSLPPLAPRNVPQMVSVDAYSELFMHMLPGVSIDAGRRFCAMAAVKSFGLTWPDAAAHLELPSSAPGYSKRAVPMINAAGNTGAFRRALETWMDRLASVLEPVDFEARRRSLRWLTDLPDSLWIQTCQSSGVHPGMHSRRRFAAAWLWAHLTQGDWRLSPAIQNVAGENTNELYVRQVNGPLARALPILGQLGHVLLGGEKSDE